MSYLKNLFVLLSILSLILLSLLWRKESRKIHKFCTPILNTSQLIDMQLIDDFFWEDKLYTERENWFSNLTFRGIEALKHKSLDLPLRETRLSHLVIPFHPRQVKILKDNLKSWITNFPCHMTAINNDNNNNCRIPLGHKIELVFFSASEHDDGRLETDLCQKFFHSTLPEHSKSCFSVCRVQHAAMGQKLNDNYLDGSRMMFEQLLHGNKFQLNFSSNIMFLEPDAIPIRDGWLSYIDKIGRIPHESFWIKGSIYRGSVKSMKSRVLYNLFHINGNAIYNLGDPDFRSFYFSYVRNFIVKYWHCGAYDTDIFKFLQFLPFWNVLNRQLSHKFQFTNFIQNRWHSEWSIDNLGNGVSIENDLCYVVHGGKMI